MIRRDLYRKRPAESPVGGPRRMNDVTRILSAIEQGDPQAAEQLLPLVYDELRKLAAQRLAQEKPGPDAPGHGPGPRGLPPAGRRRAGPAAGTAAATSSPPRPRRCAASSSTTPAASSAGSAAADCERRRPRRASTSPRRSPPDDLLALDEALSRARRGTTREAAELVKLRYFAGLTIEEAAEALGISPRDRRPPLGLRPGLAATRAQLAKPTARRPEYFATREAIARRFSH